MSLNIKLISLIHLTFACFFFSLAQNYNLYNAEEKIFPAKSIEDTFHIFISLPTNYVESDKLYPVLYVLDGDIAFGMAASIARYLQIGGNIPELIIVGIGYGSQPVAGGRFPLRIEMEADCPGCGNTVFRGAVHCNRCKAELDLD